MIKKVVILGGNVGEIDIGFVNRRKIKTPITQIFRHHSQELFSELARDEIVFFRKSVIAT